MLGGDYRIELATDLLQKILLGHGLSIVKSCLPPLCPCLFRPDYWAAKPSKTKGKRMLLKFHSACKSRFVRRGQSVNYLQFPLSLKERDHMTLRENAIQVLHYTRHPHDNIQTGPRVEHIAESTRACMSLWCHTCKVLQTLARLSLLLYPSIRYWSDPSCEQSGFVRGKLANLLKDLLESLKMERIRVGDGAIHVKEDGLEFQRGRKRLSHGVVRTVPRYYPRGPRHRSESACRIRVFTLFHLQKSTCATYSNETPASCCRG